GAHRPRRAALPSRKAACDFRSGFGHRLRSRRMQRGRAIDWDGGDVREEIARLEAPIDALYETIERCRKFTLMPKLAMAAGGLLLLVSLLGAIRFEPIALIGAITALIGGTVLFGSNTSTLKEATLNLRAAEAKRAELIDQIESRMVDVGALTR